MIKYGPDVLIRPKYFKWHLRSIAISHQNVADTRAD